MDGETEVALTKEEEAMALSGQSWKIEKVAHTKETYVKREPPVEESPEDHEDEGLEREKEIPKPPRDRAMRGGRTKKK
jgi:hypothetical protein